MYSTWNFEHNDTHRPKIRTPMEHAEQERDRLTRTNELVRTIAAQAMRELPPLSASEVLSAMFRQRGVPSLDFFTRTLVGAFRRSMDFNPMIDGFERKFMPLTRWQVPDAVVTMWTLEPVVSSTVIRGNSVNVRSANDTFSSELEWTEPMSMTTHSTVVKPDNEIRGRWAGWIVWRAAVEAGEGVGIDSVCSTCNLSSTLFGFSLHTTGAKLIHMVMTPESIVMLSTMSSAITRQTGVTISITSHGSTKLSIRPSVSANRNSSLRLFGNGSMQFCGSPTDIEDVFRAARMLVRKAVETNMKEFLSSMRQLRGPIM